jgi:formylglycine-generating enzyme required for sulfatase activity
LGMFDILGNAYEWTHDPYEPYRVEPRNNPFMDVETGVVISDDIVRVLRGGSFSFPATFLRSAYRNRLRPSNRSASFGIRPARTLP